METLFARQRQLLQNYTTKFVRSLMNEIDWEGVRLIGIRGARGVGKTTLLMQRIKMYYGADTRRALYLNLDSVYFAQRSLLDVVQQFYLSGGECLMLDEVHKYPQWSRCVKEIYDLYPTLKVVFTGSSLLQILTAEADLSRRCISYEMQGLSFREFMQFYHGINIPKCSLVEIEREADAICVEVNGKCRPLHFFGEYLRLGYYPFGKEGFAAYPTRVENVVDMVLGVELPQQRGVDVASVRKLKSLLAVMATEVPMLVDVSKLSRMVEISRVSLLSYLQYLHDARLIRLLYSEAHSVKRMQKPDKILMDNPNLCYVLTLEQANEGSVREAFFCNQVGYLHQLEYTKPADFVVDGRLTVEVGGASKDGGQIADRENACLACDGIEYPYGRKLPLWLFGLLY